MTKKHENFLLPLAPQTFQASKMIARISLHLNPLKLCIFVLKKIAKALFQSRRQHFRKKSKHLVLRSGSRVANSLSTLINMPSRQAVFSAKSQLAQAKPLVRNARYCKRSRRLLFSTRFYGLCLLSMISRQKFKTISILGTSKTFPPPDKS